MSFSQHTVQCQSPGGSHYITYSDWGGPSDNWVMCVHGLTGNGRDFDMIAPALVRKGYRVIAPDLPGRGRSEYLQDSADYNYAQYVSDISVLLQHCGMKASTNVDWVGVSLGGILGMMMAAVPGSPIRKMVINDVGAIIPAAAISYIKALFSKSHIFHTRDALRAHMQETIRREWGVLPEECWDHMVQTCAIQMDDGRFTYAYDPKIMDVFDALPDEDVDLNAVWNMVQCPVLLVRGAHSNLLTEAIAQDMKRVKPHTDLVVFEECGHVPSLCVPEHISVVCDWLTGS